MADRLCQSRRAAYAGHALAAERSNARAVRRATPRRGPIQRRRKVVPNRTGSASLGYALVLAASLPMILYLLWVVPRIMNLVYEMFCVIVSWPFL